MVGKEKAQLTFAGQGPFQVSSGPKLVSPLIRFPICKPPWRLIMHSPLIRPFSRGQVMTDFKESREGGKRKALKN